MARRVLTLVSVSAFTIGWAAFAAAQSSSVRPVPIGTSAAARGGSVHGLVRDEAGAAVAGVSIMAEGPAQLPAMARSDAAGEFFLALAPGEYVLRATREGYVSTYREPVRIQSRTSLERTIVLMRRSAAVVRPVILAAAGGAPPDTAVADDDSPADAPIAPRAHDETAWRLRHLPPSALRDVAGATGLQPSSNSASFKPRPSFVDWMMGESARAAASFFTNTNFTGQVNFLTTSSLAAAGSWLPAELPHGIAYLAVGAPVGSLGDWSVRGAMTATGFASWVVLGEYTAREDRPHAFRAGVSYSSHSQPVATTTQMASLALADRVRSVGGIYGFDRWQVHPDVELDYGVRLDRYDYVAGTQFVSPRFGVRLRVLPATHVSVLASERSVAPGANEFLPPPSAGPWLPPERTFSPLLGFSSFRAERVREFAVGIDQKLTRDANALVVGVRRFRESARDQLTTIFGLDAESAVGHYYVATPGSVVADGWILRVSGDLAPRVRGSVAYTTTQADWTPAPEALDIAKHAPSTVRRADERLHDISTSLNANFPETSTRINVAYRMDTGFSVHAPSAAPQMAGRFDVELRQALGVHPTRTSKTELVIVLRNLFRDPADTGSVYDELLTVAPPMRIMGGVQVKF